jgi:uncharacterized protein
VINVRLLHDHAALLIQNHEGHANSRIIKKYVVVSDLHLGFEDELCTSGILIDSDKLLDEMLNELIELIKVNTAEGIILLGDLKSKVGSISKQEWQAIPSFLKSLSKHASVYFVPGNHDSNIRFLTPQDVNSITAHGMVILDTLFLHGHTMPSLAHSAIKRIVMGHIHPVFFKPGSVINGQRVWLYLKVKKEVVFPSSQGMLEIIVVPSFNRYLYTTRLERGNRKPISPIIKRIVENREIENGMIVTLDGSIVGGMESLTNII